MANRFDEVAIPLLAARLMMARGQALTLRRHIHVTLVRATLAAMMREDDKRFEKGALLVDEDKLMALAQKKEGFLLEFEAEMRPAGQTFDPISSKLNGTTLAYTHSHGTTNTIQSKIALDVILKSTK